MTPCIEWTGAKTSAGYGQRRIKGKLYYTHRLSYEQNIGPIPEGCVVRHKCDNPPCFNPEHLDIGTQKDNMQDMHKRGRAVNVAPQGVKQHLAKLTDDIVRQIRDSTLGSTLLGRQLGVSKSTILRVRSGKTWRHVTNG